MFKIRGMQGSISTEVVVGIALSAVVLFVALGLFSENLSDMVSASNLKNIFEGGNRTNFAYFNRDYSDSQVDVQLVGEQGLEMLRRKANNLALELIEKPSFSSSNPNASSIAYLALVIQAMSGEPDICVYMKKDSVKHCNEDSIGGYSYILENLSGPLLTIKKVDASGSVIDIIQLNLGSSSADAIINNYQASLASDSKNALTLDQQYSFIQNFSNDMEDYVNPEVILIKKIDTFKSAKIKKIIPIPELSADLVNLLNQLKGLISNAHSRCTSRGWLTGWDYDFSNSSSGCTGALVHGLASGSNIGFVSNAEVSEFNSKADSIISLISAYKGDDADEFLNLFIQNGNLPQIIVILKNDHRNNPTSCDVFKNGLSGIFAKYGLNVAIPECIPNDT